MQGRKPMPRNIAFLSGSRNSAAMRARNEAIPCPPVEVPDAPDYLSDGAKSIFNRTARKLADMRVMTDADVEALALYSETFLRWIQATEIIRNEGMTQTGSTGSIVRHAMLDVAVKAQQECLRLMTEFGMTPSSRVRVRQDG